MLDLTKPLQTQSGLKVRLLGTKSNGQLVGLVGPSESLSVFDSGGYAYGVAEWNLINSPTTITLWANIYSLNPLDISLYQSLETANECAVYHRRIACVKWILQYSAGQGL